MAMNLVILTGRICKDIELKYSQSGSAYCNFSLAVTRAFQKDKTDFINCTAFGKTAELISQYLSKGSLTGVQGRIQTDSYEVNGERRYRTDVMVDRVEFLESKSSLESQNSVDSSNNKKILKPINDSQTNEDDDEFPF